MKEDLLPALRLEDKHWIPSSRREIELGLRLPIRAMLLNSVTLAVISDFTDGDLFTSHPHPTPDPAGHS